MKKKIHSFRANFKTSQFAQFLRQAKILILEILRVFLWLKFMPSLNLNKLKRFETGSFILAVLLITGCQHAPSQYLLFDYGAFGPQAMAWETFGMQWWQWDSHGDSDPNSKYDIKVVVYRDISLQKIQSVFPVVEAAKKDFRYIEYNEAIIYLNRNIDEVGLIDKKWAKGLKIHLINTRNRIKAFWGKTNQTTYVLRKENAMRDRAKAIVLCVMLSIASFCSLVCAGEQADERALVQDNSAFALDLYQKLLTSESNMFFSPYIISTAFGMTYAGARGETEKQMAKAMHFSLSQDKLNPAFSNLQDKLDKVQKKGHVQLHVANSLWPHNKYPFKEKFLKLVKENYKTEITAVDYVRHTEKARKTINTWVEEKTRGKIREPVPPGALNKRTRLVLTNAIYFKGNWESQFNKKDTYDGLFNLSPDKTVKTPMMHQKKGFGYWADKDLQVLEMPYVGWDLSMLVLLPTRVDGLSQLEKRLNIENLRKWTIQLRWETVDICLPKFKLEFDFSLGRVLQAMGMVDAFTDNADFSGMDGTDWLYIAAVLHKAILDVNEEGTEAAAANILGMKIVGGPSPSYFIADHPFVFLIKENQTGSILFIGRMTDPTKTPK